jgi:hypothetical protein
MRPGTEQVVTVSDGDPVRISLVDGIPDSRQTRPLPSPGKRIRTTFWRVAPCHRCHVGVAPNPSSAERSPSPPRPGFRDHPLRPSGRLPTERC